VAKAAEAEREADVRSEWEEQALRREQEAAAKATLSAEHAAAVLASEKATLSAEYEEQLTEMKKRLAAMELARQRERELADGSQRALEAAEAIRSLAAVQTTYSSEQLATAVEEERAAAGRLEQDVVGPLRRLAARTEPGPRSSGAAESADARRRGGAGADSHADPAAGGPQPADPRPPPWQVQLRRTIGRGYDQSPRNSTPDDSGLTARSASDESGLALALQASVANGERLAITLQSRVEQLELERALAKTLKRFAHKAALSELEASVKATLSAEHGEQLTEMKEKFAAMELARQRERELVDEAHSLSVETLALAHEDSILALERAMSLVEDAAEQDTVDQSPHTLSGPSRGR
jgi:hypothetical protein